MVPLVVRTDQIAAPREPHITFSVYTLFPGMFEGPLDESIIRRARERGLVDVRIHDIRDWTVDLHRSADDAPYGGGAGMVMMAPPLVAAVEETFPVREPQARILTMAAGGRLFNQHLAHELSTSSHLAMICGRYEGIDQRAIDLLDAEEISIGDYVLTGGELAALVVIDAVSRLVPGVIDPESIAEESHQSSRVEYPHYTRPRTFRGLDVPSVLLSGHHAEIARWRNEQALRRTIRLRPDLLAGQHLTEAEQAAVDDELSSISAPRE
jgi:tRNA (guanine37-N1)-methyltransferase